MHLMAGMKVRTTRSRLRPAEIRMAENVCVRACGGRDFHSHVPLTSTHSGTPKVYTRTVDGRCAVRIPVVCYEERGKHTQNTAASQFTCTACICSVRLLMHSASQCRPICISWARDEDICACCSGRMFFVMFVDLALRWHGWPSECNRTAPGPNVEDNGRNWECVKSWQTNRHAVRRIMRF